MLKNKLWIVALLVALTMAFFGCTNIGLLDDDSGPKPAVDLEIDGADVEFTACGNDYSKVKIDGNIVKFDGTTGNMGFYFEFPAEAAGYPDVEVFFKIIDITSVRPGFLIKNTDMSNFVGVANDQDPQYQLNDEDFNFQVGDEFSTGKKKVGAFKGNRMAFFHQAYNPSGNTGGTWTVEVVKIVFPGGGADETPRYTGGENKVIYDAKATGRLDDLIVDTDPSVYGTWGKTTISATGVVSMMGEGSVLYYKFPESAVKGTVTYTTTPSVSITATPAATIEAVDIDIEKDFDYIYIEYTISNVSKQPSAAGNLKARIFQLDGATVYGYDGGDWADLGGAGNHSYNLQTWGAGGKGGIAIGYNWNDHLSSGADSLDVKITKVAFATGERFKVEFFAPQTPNLNNIAAVSVLDGNGLQANLPKLANPGWTFLGWYDSWDSNTGNGDTTGTVYGANTAVTTDLKLYATWVFARPDPVTVNPTGDTWAPDGLDYGNGAGVFTDSDGKEWQVMGPRSTSRAGSSANQPGFDYFSGQDYGAEVRFTFTDVEQNAFAFDKLKVTITARKFTAAEIAAGPVGTIAFDTPIATTPGYEDAAMAMTCKVRTAQFGQGADKGYPEWAAADDNTSKVIEYNIADFNNGSPFAGMFYVFNDWQWDVGNAKCAPFLIRIEKVEFLYN